MWTHTRGKPLSFSPAIATCSGTFSFFNPGILGSLGTAGMLVNQLEVVDVLAAPGGASASGLEGGLLRNFAYACIAMPGEQQSHGCGLQRPLLQTSCRRGLHLLSMGHAQLAPL